MTFGFYFEKSRRGPSQGAIVAEEQYFEGSRAEASLVRETVQNSIDARVSDDEPVTMTFELDSLRSDDIPGVQGLREHLQWVVRDTEGTQGHEGLQLAVDTANAAHVRVLRIGDNGTTGLTGSESRDQPRSPLSALTRGAGISVDDGSRGGSMGIGSAVGTGSSAMRTVLYTSMRVDDPHVVFAGHSRLAGHRDGEGVWRMRDGFYTDLETEDDFRYERDRGPLGPFGARTEPGTDTFILGYRKAEADPGLQHIREALLTNFLLAIHRGHLVAQAVVESRIVWRLDHLNLADEVGSVPEALAFYRAILDPEPIAKISRRFGEIKLYVNIDDSLDRTLHTITVRKPLMKIDTFKHTSIPAKYAAVLECSADRGNTLLRRLEAPEHDKWDPARADDGPAALTELKSFVREGLRTRVKQQVGEQVEIKGLARYLPSELFTAPDSASANGRVPNASKAGDSESSTVHGMPGEPTPARKVERTAVPVKATKPATARGDEKTDKGLDSGGPGNRHGRARGLDGTGTPGTGESRIRADDIRFRSWSEEDSGNICLSLTAADAVHGDLELVALGPGGAAEDGYILPILSATITTNGESRPVSWDANVLRDLDLPAGRTARVQLAVTSGHRYRLGVK